MIEGFNLTDSKSETRFINILNKESAKSSTSISKFFKNKGEFNKSDSESILKSCDIKYIQGLKAN